MRILPAFPSLFPDHNPVRRERQAGPFPDGQVVLEKLWVFLRQYKGLEELCPTCLLPRPHSALDEVWQLFPVPTRLIIYFHM